MFHTRSIVTILIAALAANALGATDALVTINPLVVTHANAPLQWGMSIDARSSFTSNGKAVGYYSPTDGTPLAIGQQWETDFRQTSLRYPLGPINVWDWKATIGPIASRPVQNVPGVGQKAAFGLDEYLKMAAQQRRERRRSAHADQHLRQHQQSRPLQGTAGRATWLNT